MNRSNDFILMYIIPLCIFSFYYDHRMYNEKKYDKIFTLFKIIDIVYNNQLKNIEKSIITLFINYYFKNQFEDINNEYSVISYFYITQFP
jgi:hypothetical protein